MKILQDKVAIVTGGASGLGRAAALRLAGEGAKVSIWDLSDEQGQALVAELDPDLTYRIGRCIPAGDAVCDHILERGDQAPK